MKGDPYWLDKDGESDGAELVEALVCLSGALAAVGVKDGVKVHVTERGWWALWSEVMRLGWRAYRPPHLSIPWPPGDGDPEGSEFQIQGPGITITVVA